MLFGNSLIATVRTIKRGFGHYRTSIIALVALGFLGALLEGLGANVLVPLFAKVAGGTVEDPISHVINAMFARLHFPPTLWPLLVLISVIFVLRAVITFFINMLRARLTVSYELDVRRRLFSAFMRAKWSFLLEQKLGHLEMVLMTNIRYSAVLLEHVTTAIILMASLLAFFVIAFGISPVITILTVVVGGAVFAVIKPLLSKTSKFSSEMELLFRDTSHFLNENVLGLKTVKALTVEAPVERAGDTLFGSFARTMLRITVARAGSDAVFQPVGIIFLCVVFAFTSKSGAGLGAAAATLFLIQRMFNGFQQFQASLRAISEFTPYLRATIELEDKVAGNVEPKGGEKPFALEREIGFTQLGFTYPDGRVALSGIDFTVRKGETVGLIGPSGAGKTTVVDLFLRLFEPTSGRLHIDGVDASQLNLEDWRRHIGYVGQDVFLLNDTIANNIRFYSHVSDADMHAAAKQAAIHETITALPNGYDTMVGERGVSLSAGQRQRIIIARVLARKPSVLVLDEATSALDNESEAKIQHVIASLHGKLTVVIIAHRLSTVMGADRIVALDKGRVVEVGEPKALMENPSSYLSKAYHAGKNL